MTLLIVWITAGIFATKLVFQQIHDRSLWLRKLDDIPENQVLESNDCGLSGKSIDQEIAKPVVEEKLVINVYKSFSSRHGW